MGNQFSKGKKIKQIFIESDTLVMGPKIVIKKKEHFTLMNCILFNAYFEPINVWLLLHLVFNFYLSFYVLSFWLDNLKLIF